MVQRTWTAAALHAYLTMSHFHCSPSGQKLLTPSRYRRARCSVSAHTTLFRAVTWDSGNGQSTFTALAQGRSTLRPAGEGGKPPETHRQDFTPFSSCCWLIFLFWYCYILSFCSKYFLFLRFSQRKMVKLCLNITST